MLSQKSESVRVLIRCRPFNQKEILSRAIKCIEIQDFPTKKTPCVVKLISPRRYRRRISRLFRFDSIYDENQRTEHIFQDFVQSLVCDATLHGYSGTVFAYGQTGSGSTLFADEYPTYLLMFIGKSWTMTGCPCHSEVGLISNAIEHVFNLVHEHQSTLEQEFTIKCAYLEIYNEELHDLLRPRASSKSHSRLELRENPRSSGVQITNLTWKTVYSIDECLKFKRLGDLARTMGSTQMNRDSSRSHTMFSLSIQHQNNNQTKTFRQGKLNFVDLAGSERQVRTGASGQQLLESAKINLSLSALNKVISSLVHTHTTHIPYRDSKLTRLLQDSIGGTTKTIMIACISPSEDNYEEILCTLRYASRTKNICNTPIINENSSYILLQQYAEEIQRLRAIINSSNLHMNSTSRSMVLTSDIKFDDQHSIKTICDHQLSSETSPLIKCQRTVSCQTMSIITNEQTLSEQENYKQLFVISDENQQSYQILAWHYCPFTSQCEGHLILLVKENRNAWIGTLTTSAVKGDRTLLWNNYLIQRQHQLYLSAESNDLITHFEIRDTSSVDAVQSLVFYTSSSYVASNNIRVDQNPLINDHFITLKETDGVIYYLCDILQTSSSNEFIVFNLNQQNLYQVHHIRFNSEVSFENNDDIEVKHCCCCYNGNNESKISKLISSSHFLSLINMSCEIEEENRITRTNLHFVDLSNHFIH
ncbi:unnamed protein product [Adineta ricciae]|uniref:Kinesin-like protein n=1 Tax=Adineta ricciae TaxID=249248 RepID=A0A814B5Z3_ADIRI|nr:unnamed protein product [Adineta ricciae]